MTWQWNCWGETVSEDVRKSART